VVHHFTNPQAVYQAASLSDRSWTKDVLWRCIVSGLVGMFLGMIGSLIINIALVEISVSSFFALYFGILFIITGIVLAIRIVTAPVSDPAALVRRRVFAGLAVTVSASGLLSCFLQKSFLAALPRVVKVPLYSLLGISISFALIFSAIDLINIAVGLFRLSPGSNPIENMTQVSLILTVTLTMGAIFGFIFGLMNVDDEIQYHVRMSLLREEQYCYPIGAGVGLFAGFANEFLRQKENHYIEAKRAEFDSDI